MTTYCTNRDQMREAAWAVLVVLLLVILLLFSGCTTEQAADDAEATPEAAPLVGDTAWEHTVKGRSTIRVTEANRESGRATVERLEHIAVLLERLIEVQEDNGERLDAIEALLDRLI